MQNNKQESAWRGDFGDAYTDRNQFDDAHIGDCAKVFSEIFSHLPEGAPPQTLLEVGCNIGRNLQALNLLGCQNLFGVEPNAKARAQAQSHAFLKPEAVKDAIGAALPFADASVDLVFTSVVLIHVPEADLMKTLDEIYRVSRKYVLALEYFNPTTQTIPYRDHDDLLFKRDYGSIYTSRFPDLEVLGCGFFWKNLYPSQDNTTWWLFQKK